MAMFGRCLAFYLKYFPDMGWLYADQESPEEKPDLKELQDAERILKMVQTVGDTACREAADFLKACDKRIEPRLKPIGTFKRIRRDLTYNWELSYKHHPKGGLYLGVWIVDTIVPWVWSKGGRRAEDHIAKILELPQDYKAGSKKFQLLSSGTVALASISLPISKDQGNFDVDREPLIAQVDQAFAVLNADKVSEILGLA